MRKSIIGASDLPLASRDVRWVSSQAERRVRRWAGGEENMNWTKYKKAFFYVDMEAGEENFTSYKLQFADVIDGELKAVPRALIAVKAALLGARGGIDIPMGDKRRVARKLNKYLEKLDIEPVEAENIKHCISFLEEKIKNLLEKQNEQNIKTKSINVGPANMVDANNRILEFIATDETIDRDDDILSFDGWEIENYMKNPVVVYEHGYTVVGKVVKLETDSSRRLMLIRIQFPSLTEMSTDATKLSDYALFVDSLYNIYKNGYMKAVSVRFRNLESDMQYFGEKQVRVIKRKELLEISLTGIPANPNALIIE